MSTVFHFNFTINSLSPSHCTFTTQLAVLLSNIIPTPRWLCKFHIIKHERLVSKMEGKTNFSRRPVVHTLSGTGIVELIIMKPSLF